MKISPSSSAAQPGQEHAVSRGTGARSARPTGQRSDISQICDGAAADFLAWRAGERAALERLVRAVTPILWHVVRAYDIDEATAEDVVQITWLALVRRDDAISDPQALVRWLCVTARREAWRQGRNRLRQAPIEESMDLRAADRDLPEEVVGRKHRDEALWQAVTRLSERCQRLVRVVAFSSHPDYRSLSANLGMPVGSIGPTRIRCLAKLRALLGGAADWRMT